MAMKGQKFKKIPLEKRLEAVIEKIEQGSSHIIMLIVLS